jgi:hypothetical protein
VLAAPAFTWGKSDILVLQIFCFENRGAAGPIALPADQFRYMAEDLK